MTTVRDFSELGGEVKTEVQDCLKAVLDTARDGMALIDTGGTVIAINKAAVQLTGYAEEDILGRSFEVLRMFPLNTVADIESRFRGTMLGLELPPFEGKCSLGQENA